MVGKIAILCLVRVAASRDDVNRKAAAAQLVECRKLARSERRRDEARSMRQQQSQPIGDGRSMGANEEAIRRIGEVANQDAIEIRLLVDAGCRRNDVSIERRSVGCHHLGRYPRRDPANHLDRHGGLQHSRPALLVEGGRARWTRPPCIAGGTVRRGFSRLIDRRRLSLSGRDMASLTMFREPRRIIPDPRQEGGVHFRQPRQAEEVDAGHGGNAASCIGSPLASRTGKSIQLKSNV